MHSYSSYLTSHASAPTLAQRRHAQRKSAGGLQSRDESRTHVSSEGPTHRVRASAKEIITLDDTAVILQVKW